MRKKTVIIFSLLAVLSLLAACAGGEEGGETDAAVGNATNGETLYMGTTIGDANAPGCVTCHSVAPTEEPLQPSPVGPSHYGLADRAGDYVEGMSAEEYLREAIVEPDAHIVEGFAPGVMYQQYGEALGKREIDNLVAYLLTLESD